MAYRHLSSNGGVYYLCEELITLHGGQIQRLYKFTKSPNPARGVLCDIPEGREVEEKEDGTPVLKRRASAWTARH